MPIHAIVGVSAGALLGAYHAGVGWSIERCIHEVQQLNGGMLFALGASRTRWRPFAERARRLAGRIPEWLSLLDDASFERLHHGIERLGILAYDRISRTPVFAATGQDNDGLEIRHAARGSAAIPWLIGPIAARGRSREYRLVDGGVYDPLPVERAFEPPIDADIAIVVDVGLTPRALLRRHRLKRSPLMRRVVWVQPSVLRYASPFSPGSTTGALVESGERAITPDVLRRIRHLLDDSRSAPTPP